MPPGKVKLYNTLSQKLEIFKPVRRGQVSMYTCGPTVYQVAHIGNLRTYVFEDVLRRTLEYNGYHVRHVMNITDVGHLTSDADTGEDKVEAAARKEKKAAKEITKYYADRFKKDLRALNIKLPGKFAWATKYISEQIKLIKQLERKGYTYTTSDGVYFDTAKLGGYGKLGGVSRSAGQPLDKLGMKRVSRLKNKLDKKRATDFALWKFSQPSEKRQQEWPSPWGVGYPGWHIECSAISTTELGQPFDIHLGGEDHITIHHNNEIAQSEAAFGKPLARYWVHGAFMLMHKAKMAKSKGNFLTLSDLDIDPLAFRYLAVTSHYRQKLNFSKSALESAANSLNKLRSLFTVREKGGRVCQLRKQRFLSAVNNDLNLPKAMTVVWELVKSKKSLADKQATLLDFDKVLGLRLKNYKFPPVPTKVKQLLKDRDQARRNREWKKADRLRKEIEKLGFVIEDASRGSRIMSSQT